MRNLKLIWLYTVCAFFSFCACAGSSSGNKTTKLPPQEMTLSKGSGRQCPLLAGDYVCSSKEEKDAGEEPFVMQITQSLSATNQTRYNFITSNFTGTLLADGEIHRLNESDRSVEYSVDCQASAISWHIVAERRSNTITSLQLLNQKSASMDIMTYENGETKQLHRDCRFAPQGRH